MILYRRKHNEDSCVRVLVKRAIASIDLFFEYMSVFPVLSEGKKYCKNRFFYSVMFILG